MKKYIVIFSVLALLFTACGGDGSDQKKDVENEEVTPKVVLQRIADIEDAIEIAKGDAIITHSHRLANVLKSYADKFPKDKKAPEMLFKAANVHISINNFDQTTSLLQRIRKHYAGWEKIPETIFMQGFVHDYHLNQKGKAQGYYEKLIEKYPDHVFAKDARASIQNLGKTDEDLVREFEARRKAEAQNKPEE